MRDLVKQGGDSGVVFCRFNGGVHEPENHIHPIEGLFGLLIQELAKFVTRRVNAWRIDKNELRVFEGEDAELTAAGRLRTRRNSRNLLLEERVDERGLADIRASEDGDKT